MIATALNAVRRAPVWVARALPYAGAGSVVVLSSGLIATIFFTTVELHWLVFLAGVLTAASLSLASRSSSRAWTIARRTSQLASARAQLTSEGVLRKRAEAALTGFTLAAQYVDELPAMFCCVDLERRLLYHNRAYAAWLGRGSSRLEGRALSELHGAVTWREMGPDLDEAFGGAVVRHERMQTLIGGHRCRLATLYLPHFGERGKVIEVFCVLVDITRPEDGRASAPPAAGVDGGKEHALYSSTMAGELTTWDDAGARLKAAIAGDQFSLHAQRIEPARCAVPRGAAAAPGGGGQHGSARGVPADRRGVRFASRDRPLGGAAPARLGHGREQGRGPRPQCQRLGGVDRGSRLRRVRP
jgi:PAS domain-containing protein